MISQPAPPAQQLFAVAHATDIASMRRHAVQVAQAQGFDETAAGRVAIVATEAATNILKHAHEGMVLLQPLWRHAAGGAWIGGIELLALDKGPGIADLAGSLRDGTSTAGTAGTGLGAMRRLSDEFDIYSRPGVGTALCMRLWARPGVPAPRFACGAVSVPLRGEVLCGDAWTMHAEPRTATLVVADGLGHGLHAARASQAAVALIPAEAADAVSAPPASSTAPAQWLEAMHHALRDTRGAAVAVLQIDTDAGEVRFAGVGNIAACVQADAGCRNLVSHNGIVGHNVRKIQQFAQPWPVNGLCIAHSDGLATHWKLDAYPGLALRDPALIAGVLYRDFARGRDDVTVVVVRAMEA